MLCATLGIVSAEVELHAPFTPRGLTKRTLHYYFVEADRAGEMGEKGADQSLRALFAGPLLVLLTAETAVVVWLIFSRCVVDLQPSNGNNDALYMRHIMPAFNSALQNNGVVLLFGARQMGKSTLVKSLAGEGSEARPLTLDDPTILIQPV